MSAVLEHRPVNGETGSDQTPSKFTAVNGGHYKAVAPEPTDARDLSPSRRESDGSNKRKRHDSDSQDSHDSSDSHQSQRQRITPQVNHGEVIHSLANGSQPSQSPRHSHSRSSDAWEGSSEARLVEALGQHHGPGSTPQSGVKYPSPPPRYPHGYQGRLPPHMQNVHPGIPAPLLQKQRKRYEHPGYDSRSGKLTAGRNFANRTKTGCLTCRERKKKCDEGKPTCNNCERGGFHCKGYSTSSTSHLLKSSHSRDHHPIQAKNGVYEPTGPPQPYPHPPHPQYMPPGPAPFFPPRDSDHRGRPPPPPPPPQELQPSRNISEGAPPASYCRHSWPESHPASYPPEGVRQEYGQIAPMPDPKRLPPPSAAMHPPSTRPPSNPSYHNHRNLAQMALDQGNSQYGAPQNGAEKANMLNQQDFNPHDSILKTERSKCSKRVNEFNRLATNPEQLPEAMKTNLLRQIIKPEPEPTQSPHIKDLPTGHLGEGVEVQAPFYCDYGYNIQIGDDTEISRNCDIGDACTVKIGARCMIGPDVKFCSQDGVHHPKHARPLGSRRMCRAKPIFIGDDVFIGAGAIILPGSNIESACVIGAGTIFRGVSFFRCVVLKMSRTCTDSSMLVCQGRPHHC